MKKMALILSVLLAFTMLATSAFAATPALSGLKSNGFPIIGDKGYTKHVIYSGLPETGTEETLESGVRFASAPYGNTNLETVNSDGMITTSFKEGTEAAASTDVLDNIFSGYPVTPSTHSGIVCYEWKVRFNTAHPSKIMVQSRDVNEQWAVIASPYYGIFALGTEITIGLAYNTITGEWNLTKDGAQVPDRSGNKYYGTVGEAGLQAPQLQFTFNNLNASIDVLDAKLTYYEKTGAYSKVLFDGIPSSTTSFTNDNGVTFTTGSNVTVQNGNLVGAGATVVKTDLTVNNVAMPKGGKLYCEYAVSFNVRPNRIWFGGRLGSDYTIWNDMIAAGFGGLTAYANTQFRLGFEYDIKTGAWAYYNNGTLITSGALATPETGFNTLYMEAEQRNNTSLEFTVSDMKVIYTEEYQLPENVYLEGIDNSSRVTWTQNEGMSFEAMRNNDTRLSNNVGELVMTNSDAASDYSRLYFRFDEKPNATTHPDKLYVEFTGNLSAAPLGFHVGAYSDATEVFSKGISASYFDDSTKDNTVALVYDVSSGEWWTLVDGAKTGVSGKLSTDVMENGISNFYFQWRGANAADVFTVKNIKAGYEAGEDTVGDITIADNEASLNINKLPYSALGNEVSFIVAQYQGNRLINIEINKCAVKAGENTIKAEIPTAGEGVTVKAFVWSDENILTPLTGSITR